MTSTPWTDDRYGVLRAPQIAATPTSLEALDSFTGTTSGNALNGRVAPNGGTWVTSGAATDFTFIDAGAATTNPSEAVSRSSSSSSRRYAVIGPVMTDVQAQCKFGLEDNELLTGPCGVMARWVDASNYLYLANSVDHRLVLLRKVVAGVTTTLASMTWPPGALETWIELSLSVWATGETIGQVHSSTGALLGTLKATDSVLATGGALDDGKSGLVDEGSLDTAERWYDDIRVVAAPALDAVLYRNQSAELRTDGMIREDAAGTSYAGVESVVGALPRLPPSGLENRKVELYVKASRGDFDQIADAGIDDLSAQVHYRPAWLLTPGS